MSDSIPPEAFLAGYPEPMQAIARELCAIVRRTTPEAIERVRLGWRLIGFDLPVGRRPVYFCWVAPEPGHVHLGFVDGVAMRDLDRVMRGAGVTKKARWLTLRPGDPIDRAALASLVSEGARVARMTPAERALSAMEQRDGAP